MTSIAEALEALSLTKKPKKVIGQRTIFIEGIEVTGDIISPAGFKEKTFMRVKGK